MTRRNLAREVLAPDEYAEYEARLRMEATEPLHIPSPPMPHLADEYGYDREGRYFPERDGA